MPFIVTRERSAFPMGRTVVSRRAVATQGKVWDAVPREARKGLVGMPESGGTVGPLPDGTLIEVEPVEIAALWESLGSPPGLALLNAEIIDAFNAGQP